MMFFVLVGKDAHASWGKIIIDMLKNSV